MIGRRPIPKLLYIHIAVPALYSFAMADTQRDSYEESLANGNSLPTTSIHYPSFCTSWILRRRPISEQSSRRRLENCTAHSSNLMSLNIKTAKFAYLSACHTSAMRNFSLMDESISLLSAIQPSNYPSAVCSLWQLEDSRSAEVARDIYKRIIQGEGELNVRRWACTGQCVI